MSKSLSSGQRWRLECKPGVSSPIPHRWCSVNSVVFRRGVLSSGRLLVQSSNRPLRHASRGHPDTPHLSYNRPTTVPHLSHNRPTTVPQPTSRNLSPTSKNLSSTSRQHLANLSYPSLDPWRLTHPTVADHAGLRGCDRRSASESRCALAQASPASNPRMGWSTGPMPTILPTTYPTTALPVCGSGFLSRKRGRVRPWTRSACNAHG